MYSLFFNSRVRVGAHWRNHGQSHLLHLPRTDVHQRDVDVEEHEQDCGAGRSLPRMHHPPCQHLRHAQLTAHVTETA